MATLVVMSSLSQTSSLCAAEPRLPLGVCRGVLNDDCVPQVRNSWGSGLRQKLAVTGTIHPRFRTARSSNLLVRCAKGDSKGSKSSDAAAQAQSKFKTSANAALPPASETEQQLVEDEEYEEETWLEEKLNDVQDLTASAMQAVPGPRVGASNVPWLVAVPVAYLGVTFVWSIVRVIQRYNTPKARRRRQIGKNAAVCEAVDEFFPERREELTAKELTSLRKQYGFSTEDVVRKYLRFALNERPFGPDLVADLIHLRKVSALENAQVAEVLNEVGRRIVRAKGPMVMDTSGMTEKGIKRKAAVQGLFSKLYYLAGLEEFCSAAVYDKVDLKVIFGVTDEDAESVKIETLSETTDVASLEKMMGPRKGQPVDRGEESDDGEETEEES